MFEVIRRLLWYAPSIALFATLWFAALARAIPDHELLFPSVLNLRPDSLDSEAAHVTESLFRSEEGAKEKIVRLGGAALPVYLKRWHGYSLREQSLLASALAPVLLRMGIVEDGDFGEETQTEAVAYMLALKRFEEERQSELHPAAVARLVRRLSTSDYRARLSDLELADTYALPYLFAELGPVDSEKDAERVRRILVYLARVVPEARSLERPASILDARIAVTKLRRYWDHEAHKFSSATPLGAIVSPLEQTELLVFSKRILRELTRKDDPAELRRVYELTKKSGPLALAYAIGALLLSPLLAAGARLSQLASTRRSPHRSIVIGPRYLLAAALAFTTILVVRPRAEGSGAFFIVLLTSSILTTFVLDRDLGDRMDHRMEFLLSRRSMAHRIRAIARLVGPTLPTLLPLLVAEAFLVLSLVEHQTKRSGLGSETILALRAGDLPFVFLLSLLLSGLTSVVHVLGDATLNPFIRLRRPR